MSAAIAREVTARRLDRKRRKIGDRVRRLTVAGAALAGGLNLVLLVATAEASLPSDPVHGAATIMDVLLPGLKAPLGLPGDLAPAPAGEQPMARTGGS